MSDSGDMQPSLIQYARFHGLASDHLHEDIYGCFPLYSFPCDEDATLPQFEMPCLEKLPPEPKFRLDSKAKMLLASGLKPPPAPHWSATLSDHRQVKSLKLEQPVLKSDHEEEMKKIRCRKPHKIKPMDLLPIGLGEDEDEDESLAWPLHPRDIAASWDKKAAKEKLQTTRGVLKVLQDTLRPVYTPQMHEAIVAEDLALAKRQWVEPLSLERFSFERDQEIYLLSSPASGTEMLSEAPDQNYEQPHKLNEEISNQSRIMTGDAGRIEGLLQSAKQGRQSDEMGLVETHGRVSMKQEQHTKIFKLKPPHTEPSIHTNSLQKPDAKRVTSALGLENLLPEQMECQEQGRDETDRPFEKGPLAGMADEVAQPVEKALARENSELGHTTMRVEVPKLDDSKLAAPNKIILSTGFLEEILEDHLVQTVRSFGEEDERTMKWEPIPNAFLKLVIDEGVEPQPRLNEWTSQPAFATTSADLLWRPDVLRILSMSEDSDEEELEEDSFLKDEPARKLEPPSKRPAPMDQAQSFGRQEPDRLSFPEGQLASSGLGSLAGFMDTRKAYKKPRLEPEPEPSRLVERDTAPMIATESKILDEIQVPAITPTASSTMDMFVQRAPQVPEITSPRSIIVRSGLLNSHRRLTQALETRPDPPLIIVYRDLDSGTDTDAKPDIIIAPATAAILITLQMTTQRSLPGQGHSHPAIFNRILRLSQFYERVLVITTLPSADISPLSLPVTCSHISILTSFCASLSGPQSDSVVQAILVPIPAPPSIIATEIKNTPADPLFTWTHALILKHTLDPISTSHSTSPHGPILLPEETLWELFLCRAGMNPYAAQMVLGMLKKPENTHHPDGQQQQQKGDQKSTPWGLRAFVQMSRDKRAWLFGSVVGTRAVERVSDVLDMAWGAAGGDNWSCG